MSKHLKIPKQWEVQPIDPKSPAFKVATCGYCGLSWDDGKLTSITPVPAGRCPFEPFHLSEKLKVPSPLETFRRGVMVERERIIAILQKQKVSPEVIKLIEKPHEQ